MNQHLGTTFFPPFFPLLSSCCLRNLRNKGKTWENEFFDEKIGCTAPVACQNIQHVLGSIFHVFFHRKRFFLASFISNLENLMIRRTKFGALLLPPEKRTTRTTDDGGRRTTDDGRRTTRTTVVPLEAHFFQIGPSMCIKNDNTLPGCLQGGEIF